MKLELISHPLCPYVHRTTIMLREKGIEFSLQYIDLQAKPDWFLKISPRGRVPVLVADGTPLFESSVINEFIDETHPPRILPDNPFERAVQRAWVEVANDVLAAQYRLMVATSPDALAKATTDVTTLLQRVEDGLVAGTLKSDRLGLVEIALAPALFRFHALGDRVGVLESTPLVRAWADALAVHPSVAGTVPTDFASRFESMLVQFHSSLAQAA